MKAVIDHNGSFYIKRKDGRYTSNCPLLKFDNECGDFCSLFGEPILKSKPIHQGPHIFWEHSISLSLCHKTYEFQQKDFEDKRKDVD